MATFKGFNTIGQHKKFGLTDFDLIKRDLLNAFLTREGELPGRPDLGSRIWNFIFEPMVEEVRYEIEQEVRRIILSDPRLEISSIEISSNHNTVIIEAAVLLLPDTSPESLAIVFDKQASDAIIL